MKLYSVFVRRDPDTEVRKDAVTPAEIALLRALYGDDSVRDIEESGELSDGYTANDERARLGDIYGAEKVSSLWAGSVPLPRTLEDAQVDPYYIGNKRRPAIDGAIEDKQQKFQAVRLDRAALAREEGAALAHRALAAAGIQPADPV